MFKKKQTNSEIDYENEFKVIIASNSPEKDQLKVQPSTNSLRSLESFSRSSESLALSVTPIESKKHGTIKRKNKSRSATRSCNKEETLPSNVDESADYGVTRDQGESYMSKIMRNVNKDSKNLIGDFEEEKERLRLMNIKLESKSSRVCQENEEYLQERFQLKKEIEKIQQNLSDSKSFNEIFEELELINRERSNDKRKINELENSLQIKNAEIKSKSIDFEQTSNELNEYQENLNQTNGKMRLIIEELNEKSSVLSDLKKKLSEYHSQLELTKLYRENSEYRAEQLESELNSMKKTRKWFEEQLEKVEEAKEKLNREVERINRCLVDSRRENEDYRQKSRSLELKLIKFQEIKLNETTALLFELEQLQKEILISDEEKRELEDRYSEIMKKYNEKIGQLELEQEKNRLLNQNSEELKCEIEEIRSQFDRARLNIDELEVEGIELRKKLDVLGDHLQFKSANFDLLEQEKSELEKNLKEIGGENSEKDRIIRDLQEEIGVIKLSFDRIRQERDRACVGIEKMKEEIVQVANRFEETRQNLMDKEQVLKLMEELNDELKEKLVKETEELQERNRTIQSMKSEKNQLLESCEQFQHNNLQIQQELDSLRNNLNSAYYRIAELEEEISGMKSENRELNVIIENSRREIDKFRTELEEAQEQIENLSNSQGLYGKLFDDKQLLEEEYNELFGKHKSLREEFQQVRGELEEKLIEREEELERIVAMKEEVVCASQKDLLSADQTRKELKNELETVKFNHTVELATKEEQFREQLDKSCRDLSEMCQEKIRCERAIASLQDHIQLLAEEYTKKLTDCKTKMLRLEQQSTEYAEHENRNRSLLEELERKKGEIEAIIEIWKKMKQHVENVENESARRDAKFSILIDKHEEKLMKKDEEIKILKETIDNQCDRLKCEEELSNNFAGQLEERVSVIDQLRKKIDNYERNETEMDLQKNRLNSDLEQLCRENQLLKENQQQLAEEIERKTLENRDLMIRNQSLLKDFNEEVLLRNSEKRTADDLKQEFDSKCSEMITNDSIHQDLIRTSQIAVEELSSVFKNVSEQNDSLTRRVELSQQQDLVMTTMLNKMRSQIKKIIFQQEIQQTKDESINLSFEQLNELTKLLDDSKEPNFSFRPQSRLSKCIEDLRTQIDSMQVEISNQIDELQPQALECTY